MCMKGISMPNYTIDKGTLAENMATAAIEYPFAPAENMATAAIEYPFAPAENMAGRAEELHRRRLLKGTGDNYGNGG